MTKAATHSSLRKVSSRWGRVSLWSRWTLLVLAVLLVAARPALPYPIKSYVNRRLRELDVSAWEKDHKKNILKLFWQAIVGVVSQAFKNQPHNQLATEIPISGTYDQSHVDLIATIDNLLKNAFIRALLPNIGQPVTLQQAAESTPPAPAKPKSH